MKTLEDKLYLNTAQQQSIDQWLGVQRRVWNEALALLKEFEAFAHYNKHDKAYAPCCPIPWQYRWIKGEAEGKEEWIAVPYSPIGFKPKYGEYKQSCPLPQTYREPAIAADLVNPKTGTSRTWQSALASIFAHERHEWLRDSGVPSKITQGTIKALVTAWEEYRKGKRKSPRFKSKHNPLRTLNDTQTGNASIQGNCIRLPKLGSIRVRSLTKRITSDTPIKTYRIIKEPSGYYLMVVVDVPYEVVKPSDKVTGFDAGVTHLLTDDQGTHIAFPGCLDKQLKRLKRLQQKMSRRTLGSANWHKAKAEVAHLHERIRRNRKAYHHKISTFAIRKYGAIAVEALNLKGMVRRPKKKLSEDGTHYEANQASAKAGLNRKLLDAAIGTLYTMLDEKAKRHERVFEEVPAPDTSRRCNACGFVSSENRLEQAVFKCLACGHAANADANAACNIKEKAFDPERYTTRTHKASEASEPQRYPALTGELKPALESSMDCQQEEGLPSSASDASPIPNLLRECEGVQEAIAPEQLLLLDLSGFDSLEIRAREKPGRKRTKRKCRPPDLPPTFDIT